MRVKCISPKTGRIRVLEIVEVSYDESTQELVMITTRTNVVKTKVNEMAAETILYSLFSSGLYDFGNRPVEIP